MKLHLSQAVCEAIGLKRLKAFHIADDFNFSYKKHADLNLAKFSRGQVKYFLKLCQAKSKTRGMGVIIKDIEQWLSLVSGEGAEVKPRTVEQFYAMIRHVLEKAPGHRVYHQDKKAGDIWWVYYVNMVQYHPPEYHKDWTTPAYVTMHLIYSEFDGMDTVQVSWHAEDCVNRFPSEVLARSGYYVETPERRTEYLAQFEQFQTIIGNIGKQYNAVGYGTDDVDGNSKEDEVGSDGGPSTRMTSSSTPTGLAGLWLTSFTRGRTTGTATSRRSPASSGANSST